MPMPATWSACTARGGIQFNWGNLMRLRDVVTDYPDRLRTVIRERGFLLPRQYHWFG